MVDFIQFEYNDKWQSTPDFSPKYNLEHIVHLLDSLNYDTYLCGVRNAVQLNGFWQPEYEFFHWSNCISMGRHVSRELRSQILKLWSMDYRNLDPLC